jgi:hypothetical protein
MLKKIRYCGILPYNDTLTLTLGRLIPTHNDFTPDNFLEFPIQYLGTKSRRKFLGDLGQNMRA